MIDMHRIHDDGYKINSGGQPLLCLVLTKYSYSSTLYNKTWNARMSMHANAICVHRDHKTPINITSVLAQYVINLISSVRLDQKSKLERRVQILNTTCSQNKCLVWTYTCRCIDDRSNITCNCKIVLIEYTMINYIESREHIIKTHLNGYSHAYGRVTYYGAPQVTHTWFNGKNYFYRSNDGLFRPNNKVFHSNDKVLFER